MAKSVAATLLSLQQELAKPPPVFEPYKALVGLEIVSRFGTGQGTCQNQTIQHYSTPMLPPPGQTALPKRSIKFGRRQRKCRGGESYPNVPAFFCFVLAYFRAT